MKDFKTGDMFLCIGNGAVSNFITSLPSAKYSHVMFYYEHGLLGPCIYESTSIGSDPDVFTGELIKGVQVTRCLDRINNYDGEVYVRRLRDPLTEDQTVAFIRNVNKYHGTPYEASIWQLMKAQLDVSFLDEYVFPWLRNEQDESTLFCSELVTRVLRDVGLVEDTDLPTNEVTPTNCAVWWGDVYFDVEPQALDLMNSST